MRWNSTKKMITRFLLLRDSIIELTTSPRKFAGLTYSNVQMLSKIQLNEQEWSILSILVEILNPISKATNILSGRHYATLSSAFYVRKRSFASIL